MNYVFMTVLYLPGFFLDKWLFEGHGKTFVFLVHLMMPILSINLFSCICNSLFNPFLQKLSLSWLGSDFLAETGQTSDCLASGETQWPIVQCWFWTLERTQHLYPGNCSQELCMWDRPGTWDSLLQCLHLKTALFKLQNTKKLFGLKITTYMGS